MRVGLLCGCVGPVLAPEIQAACERLLQRAGVEVVRVRRESCCGALAHHLGRDAQALAMARASVDAWDRELAAGPLAAIVVTASGCGTQLRDYGHLLRDDPRYAVKAARVAALACDVTEIIDRIGLPPRVRLPAAVVGYHAACSLQHGQKVQSAPVRVLTAAGFEVRVPADAHLCCGSAGVYNILQPGHSRRARYAQGGEPGRTRAGCDRGGQYRLHGADPQGGRTCRWCTSRSCSIGRPAARRRTVSRRRSGAPNNDSELRNQRQ